MLKKLWRRCREMWSRESLDREAQEELAYHLEMEVAQRVRDGADAEDARRRTRIELGDFEDVQIRFEIGRFVRLHPRLLANVQLFSARKPG